MKPPATWRPAAAGNFGAGRRNPISRITFHHIVGDANGAIARFQTPGVEVSSTYVIGSNGAIYQMVKEEDTPYTDANADSNSRSVTIEHAGPPYAEAMYQSSIKLCAYLIAKYKIGDFKRHRDVSSKPTACPGNLDVERIVREAQKLSKGEIMFSEDQIKVLASKGSIPQTAAQLKEGSKKPAYDVALNFLLTVRNRLQGEKDALAKENAELKAKLGQPSEDTKLLEETNGVLQRLLSRFKK